MATTTNYSWTTPDDTDLVKDGAAAIRTLGSSADTTVKALNPGTTAGDIDYYTTSTAKARVGIGTAGQVLQVNSGATAPEWATVSSGAMTLISTTTLSGATTTVGSIPSGYQQLLVRGFGVTNATASGAFRVAINSDATSSSYAGVSPAPTAVDINQQKIDLLGTTANVMLRTGGLNAFALTIDNYASSTAYKSFITFGAGADNQASIYGGYHKSNTAITSLVFENTGGDLTGGTIELYGVK